ncbi:ABC transporter permease subunit [Desulfosporosinus lacus]|uniref:Peptide/nickel transport system permease protein n=1 Tax=Desulfosporosinus lacus DSM 15449 TaxID=1121420 RepID=A0A1M6A3E3_9FIRM|nr:ABC transporter permease subunit [Desulfosporosinus lacus]SHI30978.1 peptide/nickel transport system permease protein [Desulfosporosinus lacus DSM 15449]
MAQFRYLRYFTKRYPLTVTGAVIIFLVVMVSLAAPLVSPHNPYTLNLTDRLKPPGSIYLLGTDELGRDILSRIIYGARLSLLAGVGIVGIAGLFGIVIGSVSGLLGGKVDQAVMRLMDIMLAFPSLVLALALSAALGANFRNSILAIAIVKIPVYVRLVRGQALSIKERQFVKAAQTFGAPKVWIISRHIIPNCLAPVVVQATLGIGEAILIAATLSFIGLGAQPPAAEWGAMVSMGRIYLLDQWWYASFPGIAIFITVIGFNLFGDGVRDMLDPRFRN